MNSGLRQSYVEELARRRLPNVGALLWCRCARWPRWQNGSMDNQTPEGYDQSESYVACPHATLKLKTNKDGADGSSARTVVMNSKSSPERGRLARRRSSLICIPARFLASHTASAFISRRSSRLSYLIRIPKARAKKA